MESTKEGEFKLENPDPDITQVVPAQGCVAVARDRRSGKVVCVSRVAAWGLFCPQGDRPIPWVEALLVSPDGGTSVGVFSSDLTVNLIYLNDVPPEVRKQWTKWLAPGLAK